MEDRCHRRSTVLVTGATGFLGHYVLADLLRRGVRCAALLRPPVAKSLERLRALLVPLGAHVDRHLRDGSLAVLEADLNELDPGARLDGLRGAVAGVVHCAASTRFDIDARGEPARTNVMGTARLLEWMGAAGAGDLHLVSTAFVCGRTSQPARETILADAPDPHNDYELSKWGAEQSCAAWANGAAERNLTVHRPSVIVGEHASGRATKFDGFYVTARATELLERRYADAGAAARRNIPLRIKARPDDRQNIVPVDWVARMIGGIVATPRLRGRVYHLVHPSPPSNATIKRALERHFGIGGGRFVDPDRCRAAEMNDEERLFGEISRPVEHYIIDSPRFERGNGRDAERALGLSCPDYDEPALRRLVRFAQEANWGRRRGAAKQPASMSGGEDAYAAYFERFLPEHVGQSRVARATAMDAVIRFVIDDSGSATSPGGSREWICRFESGALVEVRRGGDGGGSQQADFGYRASGPAFWRAISGEVHPQELFLSGDAEIFGDTERALKMIMILNAFSREFPCSRERLGRGQCRRSA